MAACASSAPSKSSGRFHTPFGAAARRRATPSTSRSPPCAGLVVSRFELHRRPYNFSRNSFAPRAPSSPLRPLSLGSRPRPGQKQGDRGRPRRSSRHRPAERRHRGVARRILQLPRQDPLRSRVVRPVGLARIRARRARRRREERSLTAPRCLGAKLRVSASASTERAREPTRTSLAALLAASFRPRTAACGRRPPPPFDAARALRLRCAPRPCRRRAAAFVAPSRASRRCSPSAINSRARRRSASRSSASRVLATVTSASRTVAGGHAACVQNRRKLRTAARPACTRDPRKQRPWSRSMAPLRAGRVGKRSDGRLMTLVSVPPRPKSHRRDDAERGGHRAPPPDARRRARRPTPGKWSDAQHHRPHRLRRRKMGSADVYGSRRPRRRRRRRRRRVPTRSACSSRSVEARRSAALPRRTRATRELLIAPTARPARAPRSRLDESPPRARASRRRGDAQGARATARSSRQLGSSSTYGRHVADEEAAALLASCGRHGARRNGLRGLCAHGSCIVCFAASTRTSDPAAARACVRELAALASTVAAGQ